MDFSGMELECADVTATGAVVVPEGGLSLGSTALTATSAELNLLDGSSVANDAASKAAVLDASKQLRTDANVGTAGTNVTAVEYGDGRSHVTVLTASNVALTIGDNANLALGAAVYTLPAGAQVIDYSYLSVAISATDVANQSDTPEVGLGTTVGSGANATLGAVGTGAENIFEGTAAADCDGTATVATKLPTAGTPLIIASGDSHVVYLNLADGWADGTDQSATASGTIVLVWKHLA